MVDRLQRVHASIQDQSLQCLHQMGHESHRPEAADVFSERWLEHW